MSLRPTLARACMNRIAHLAVIALGLLLSGCAILPWGNATPTASAPEPVLIPMYHLEIDAPAALRPLLSNHLDLARFQTSTEADGISRSELARLVAAAPAQAKALLETEGYFNAEVRAQTLPEATSQPTPLPQVKLVITPGPRTVVGSLALDVQGHLRESLQHADSAAISTWGALHRDWLLRPDSEFRQAQWDAAKAAMLDRLRIDGYPGARWAATQARIDADSNTAALDITADSGPLYRLGKMRIEGLQRHDEAAVRHTAQFAPGTPYSERLLIDFAERLRKIDLFESTVVELDPQVDDPSAATVLVRVRELPLQQATVGAGFSDNTGPRISLEHTHRRVFGQPWVSKNKIELGRDRKSWDAELISHPVEGGYRRLLAFSAAREEAAGTLVQSSRLRAGRALDTEKLERLVFAEALTAHTRNAVDNRTDRAVSGNVHWVRRDLDSVLLPTDGYTLNLQAAVGHAWSNTQDSGAFGRAYARYTLYRPVGKTWYASARLEAAQVLAGDQVGVPDKLLFRAGGDDSVRGYDYRSLGPSQGGVVNSGRMLLTGSMELATPISLKLPSLWGAVFVDAGQAANHWRDLHPVYGYGVGLRWRSPVGPLKLDLAYGEAVNKVRLHLSVGIAF